MFDLMVAIEADEGKEVIHPTEGLLAAVGKTLRTQVPASAVQVVRKSFDARGSRNGGPKWNYGSGPAGLFATLVLAEAGVDVVLMEKGKAVEHRGRDIGALFHRRVLNPNSNVCYGEGGAGTWSDGKLTTRIGKNSSEVRRVLESLVRFGAPERILVDGKPHVGTDRLVRILRSMRAHLLESGAEVWFDANVAEVCVSDRQVTGVRLED
eukprot:gene20528-24604_t